MTSMTETSIIHTPFGPIQGIEEGPVRRYIGIPYAKAERFQPPKPVETWTETFRAVEPVPVCPQPPDPAAALLAAGSIIAGLKVDENCQGLSITLPSDIKPDEKLSVMVWFHGGAFVWGAADAAVYNPSKLVAENRVIVVNVGSRLSIFGYLGNGSTRPANLGLLDVLEALRWVKRNIAAFGGNDDARSITIFGQSAGGSTVSDIMMTEEATSLFGRAIIQSAPFGVTRGREAMNKSLFEVVAHASASTTYDELCDLITKVMVAAKPFGIAGGMPFAPQYGNAPLPAEDKIDVTLGSHAKQIDVLIGQTAEEASMFVNFMPTVEKATKLPLIGLFVHRTFVSIATTKLYARGIKVFAQRYIQAGGKLSSYTITFGPPDPRIGAMHAVELPLLFGSEKDWKGSALMKDLSWDQVERDGQNLRKIWADFAKGKQPQKSDSIKGVVEFD